MYGQKITERLYLMNQDPYKEYIKKSDPDKRDKGTR